MAQRLLERAASMLRGLQAVRPSIASQVMHDSTTFCQPTVLAGWVPRSLPHLADAAPCTVAQV